MRSGQAAHVVLLTLVVWLTWTASASACGTGRQAAANAQRAPGARAALFVGDSTGILAVGHLARRGIEADAKGCRQFGAGIDILRARRRSGRLAHLVVLALGANGSVDSSAIRRALKTVGTRRVLALVTPRNQAGGQASMRRAARRYPHRVLLVDWAAFSRGKQGWFAGDGLHVSQTGARAYAAFIRRQTVGTTSPPSHSLRFSLDGPSAKGCGTVRRAGRRLRVAVVRGVARATCARAAALARRPPLQPTPNWRWWDWTPVRRGGLVDVFRREDRRVIVVTRTVAAR
jgi:hypothetical protein